METDTFPLAGSESPFGSYEGFALSVYSFLISDFLETPQPRAAGDRSSRFRIPKAGIFFCAATGGTLSNRWALVDVPRVFTCLVASERNAHRDRCRKGREIIDSPKPRHSAVASPVDTPTLLFPFFLSALNPTTHGCRSSNIHEPPLPGLLQTSLISTVAPAASDAAFRPRYHWTFKADSPRLGSFPVGEFVGGQGGYEGFHRVAS